MQPQLLLIAGRAFTKMIIPFFQTVQQGCHGVADCLNNFSGFNTVVS